MKSPLVTMLLILSSVPPTLVRVTTWAGLLVFSVISRKPSRKPRPITTPSAPMVSVVLLTLPALPATWQTLIIEPAPTMPLVAPVSGLQGRLLVLARPPLTLNGVLSLMPFTSMALLRWVLPAVTVPGTSVNRNASGVMSRKSSLMMVPVALLLLSVAAKPGEFSRTATRVNVVTSARSGLPSAL